MICCDLYYNLAVVKFIDLYFFSIKFSLGLRSWYVFIDNGPYTRSIYGKCLILKMFTAAKCDGLS